MSKINRINTISEYYFKRDFGYIIYTDEFALMITIQSKKGHSGIGCGYWPEKLDIEGAVLKSWRTCKKVEKQGHKVSWHLILETNRGEVGFYVYNENVSDLKYRARITMEAHI